MNGVRPASTAVAYGSGHRVDLSGPMKVSAFVATRSEQLVNGLRRPERLAIVIGTHVRQGECQSTTIFSPKFEIFFRQFR